MGQERTVVVEVPDMRHMDRSGSVVVGQRSVLDLEKGTLAFDCQSVQQVSKGKERGTQMETTEQGKTNMKLRLAEWSYR